jgi:hypothetical protein
MGNDPPNCREFGLQAILDLIDDHMHIIDWFRRLETTMIVNKQALIILTDSDIMNSAETGLFLGQRQEQAGDGI